MAENLSPSPLGNPMDAEVLHEQLRRRAFLHDDPEAYLAGVDDALAVLTADPAAAWKSDEALRA